MIRLSSIIHTFEAEFLAQYQGAILPSQRNALEALTLTEIDPPLLTKTDPPGGVPTQSDPVDKEAVVGFHCRRRC